MGGQCRGHAAGSQTPCRCQAPVLHPQRSCMGSTHELQGGRRSENRNSLCMWQPPSAWEQDTAPRVQVLGGQVLGRPQLEMWGQPLQVTEVAIQRSPTWE